MFLHVTRRKERLRVYRVAAINPEFLFSFFDMTHYSWKPYDFIELKTGWQRNILRINSYNNTAVSSDDSLDPGAEPPAGLRHGVPREGPHHLPDLRDQGLGLVMKLCSDPQFRDATRKIVQRAAFSGAGGQISFSHTSMRFFLSQSCVFLLLSAGVPVHCVKDFLSCSHYLALINFPYHQILQKQ